MGLTSDYDSLPNYIVYLLFILLMCTILINLFVGIAVGEIKTVLDEADIQQISMRIMFVLKIQSAIYPFRNTFLSPIFNMSYEKYDTSTKNAFVRFTGKVWKRVLKTFQSREPAIILQDPQKRLEDSFLEMSVKTNDQIKSIKSLFDNQVNDVRAKLSNSQVRVEDNLNEMTRNTTTYLDSLLEELNANSKKLLAKLENTETKLEQLIVKHSQRSIDELNYVKVYFDDKLNKIELKLNTQIDTSNKNTLSFLDSLNKTFLNRTHDIENSLNKSEKSLFDCTVDSSKSLNAELKTVKDQSAQFQVEIRGLHDQVAAIQEQLRQREREKELEKAREAAEKEKEKEKETSKQSRWEPTPSTSTSRRPGQSSNKSSSPENPWGILEEYD
jgi:hypothetical protein